MEEAAALAERSEGLEVAKADLARQQADSAKAVRGLEATVERHEANLALERARVEELQVSGWMCGWMNECVYGMDA